MFGPFSAVLRETQGVSRPRGAPFVRKREATVSSLNPFSRRSPISFPFFPQRATFDAYQRPQAQSAHPFTSYVSRSGVGFRSYITHGSLAPLNPSLPKSGLERTPNPTALESALSKTQHLTSFRMNTFRKREGGPSGTDFSFVFPAEPNVDIAKESLRTATTD